LAAPVRIIRIDAEADTAGVRACFQIARDCDAADDPAAPPWSWSTFRAVCALGHAGEPKQLWLARDDRAEPAGYGLLELPDRENTSRAWLFLSVPPDRRRHGVGTRLLRHCAEQARLAGRKVLDGRTIADTESAGSAFATSIGAQPGPLDLRRELLLDAGLQGRLRGLKAQAAARSAGYSLVDLTGDTPEPLVGDMARIVAAGEDAPRDPGREAEVWDADRIRAADRWLALSGDRRYIVLARHDASGELAAMTSLYIGPERPEFGFQGLTAVAREHRGHRLGLATKVAMLELLAQREPQLERIMTFNAADNSHMIAINEQLGFQVSGEFRSWEVGVGDICR
jgi:RimJ/RimL family protein N-acetyltransferase